MSATAASSAKSTKGKPKVLGAFEFGRKVLRFYGVWDCRANLFGDELKVKVHYSLADGALEIVPVHERNGGRDRLPKYLKRTQVLFTVTWMIELLLVTRECLCRRLWKRGKTSWRPQPRPSTSSVWQAIPTLGWYRLGRCWPFWERDRESNHRNHITGRTWR